jgi:membrane associated rhomboid family serine protease
MTDTPLWRRFLGVPDTRPGWWSLALALGFFVFLALIFLWGRRTGHDRSTFFSDPIMAATVLATGACGVCAGLTGAAGVLWKHERSVLVFAAIVLGAFVAYFAIGEIASGTVGR